MGYDDIQLLETDVRSIGTRDWQQALLLLQVSVESYLDCIGLV